MVEAMTVDEAHEHANNAQNYLSQGLLIPAAEEYYKAAEGFKACIDTAADESTKRVFRLLYNNNTTAGRDIQRRIAQLKEEGKDPSQPQPSPIQSPRSADAQALPISNRGVPPPPRPPPPPTHSRLPESMSTTVDESYLLLNQQAESSDDPFNMFWKATENIIENLYPSGGGGFANAALAALDQVDAQKKEAMRSQRLDASRMAKSSKRNGTNSTANSRFAPSKSTTNMEESDIESDDSFCFIESSAEASSSNAKLKKENADLKTQLVAIQDQMEKARQQMARRMEQDQQLRDHVLQARKEAQRVMATSTTIPRGQSAIDIAGLSLNVSQAAPLNIPRPDREKETLQRRVKELEDEVRVLRVENDKQKAMITKFRERWEKLKESAKRKREAKSAAQNVQEQRIDEDPEAEKAAEEEAIPEIHDV